MKISKISLLNNEGIIITSYQLSDSVNIFYGLSGNGKTLLFNLICYALASSIEIDINEIHEFFNNLTYVELTLDKNFIIKRKVIDSGFEGAICGDAIQDKTKYRDLIEDKMGFKKVKLIKIQ